MTNLKLIDIKLTEGQRAVYDTVLRETQDGRPPTMSRVSELTGISDVWPKLQALRTKGLIDQIYERGPYVPLRSLEGVPLELKLTGPALRLRMDQNEFRFDLILGANLDSDKDGEKWADELDLYYSKTQKILGIKLPYPAAGPSIQAATLKLQQKLEGVLECPDGFGVFICIDKIGPNQVHVLGGLRDP